jgi:hypothetical protein
LCGCDRGQAWPRIVLTEKKYGFSFKLAREQLGIDNAIRDGCRACALLKEGIGRFVDLDLNSTQVKDIWVGLRKIDDAWLASLDMVDGKTMTLELIDGSGDYFAVNLAVAL